MPEKKPRLRDSRIWRAETRSASRLERDGYFVVRAAPNQKSSHTAADLIRLVAVKGSEVQLVAVRVDRPLTIRDRRRLFQMTEGWRNAKIVEHLWRELDRAPEVSVIE